MCNDRPYLYGNIYYYQHTFLSPSYCVYIFNHERCRFMAVSPVLCRLTHSLSDDQVLAIFFFGGICSSFHATDTAVLVLLSDCFLFCLRVDANVIIYLHFAYICVYLLACLLTYLLTYSMDQSPF
jgi:hypothetical protein